LLHLKRLRNRRSTRCNGRLLQLLKGRDPRRFREVSGFLILGVDERHFGQSDKSENVP
jgi:hypothetical protein